YFDLRLVRLGGGQLLEPDPWFGQDPGECAIGAGAGKTQQFVGETGDDRDPQDPGDHQETPSGNTEEGEQDDRAEYHDEEKAGAATGVFGRVTRHRFDVEGFACFEGVDRHVLGAVILEDPGDVFGSTD